MRPALSRDKGMLKRAHGDENKNALETYISVCAEGNVFVARNKRWKTKKRRTRISQKDPYIYICRIYSAKVAMSSRPIGFHGTRCNKRLVVSFVRALSERGGPIFSRGICPVSGTEERYASRPLFGGDHVESTGRTDFDRPIDSYAEIRKCLHASSGYNYFAPKFLMKYVR